MSKVLVEKSGAHRHFLRQISPRRVTPQIFLSALALLAFWRFGGSISGRVPRSEQCALRGALLDPDRPPSLRRRFVEALREPQHGFRRGRAVHEQPSASRTWERD